MAVYAADTRKIGYGQGTEVDGDNRPLGAAQFNSSYSGLDAFALSDEKDRIILTFDQGYENGYTSKILDTLKEKGVHAVFFLTGDYAKKEPELVKRMIAEGHVLGNHGMTHASLPELSEGDVFIITVLDRKMTYQVDQILTVLPSELDALQVVDGQDYVTLMTCTPYGINTHRLLVRGHRIENLPEQEIKSIPVQHVERELTTQEKVQKYIPFAVMGVAVLFLIALLMPAKKKDHSNERGSGGSDDESKTC